MASETEQFVLTPPETSTPVLSLAAKLAEACAAVSHVEKRGKNTFQGYDYVKAADVAIAIRQQFFSRKIIVVCDEKEFTQIRSITTNKGAQMGEFLLRAEFTFIDGDSGEKLGPFGAFGVAMDSGDKAVYKAKTGALKYVLRGIGLIPDENADPEADSHVDEVTSQPHTQRPVQGVSVDFGPNYAQEDFDESELLDEPPKTRPFDELPPKAVPQGRPAQPGQCKACGGKIIPAGVSKKTGKPYPAFCKECKAKP